MFWVVESGGGYWIGGVGVVGFVVGVMCGKKERWEDLYVFYFFFIYLVLVF